jgi:hypothetical protein
MKTKLTALILAAALTLAIVGCASEPEPAEPKDTPHRIGTQGYASGSLAYNYTFEGAIETSDLVVDITILEWLGESSESDDYHGTYFLANINSTFKGIEYDTIIMRQNGSSRITFTNYPLFKNGDRMLAFLKETTDGVKSEQYERIFWIIGADATIFDIWEYNDETYLLSRANAAILEEMIESDDITNADNNLLNSIVEQHNEFDPVLKDVENVHKYAFYFDDVINEIAKIVNENNE